MRYRVVELEDGLFAIQKGRWDWWLGDLVWKTLQGRYYIPPMIYETKNKPIPVKRVVYEARRHSTWFK